LLSAALRPRSRFRASAMLCGCRSVDVRLRAVRREAVQDLGREGYVYTGSPDVVASLHANARYPPQATGA
jgi:hypothetical protein